MSDFVQACRPIIFEHDQEDFPYWGKGSSFLIANSRNYYWITASHVLKNLGGSAASLRIFPTDNSTMSLPFNEQYTIKQEFTAYEDFTDLFMLRINLTEFDIFGDAPLIAQDIEKGIYPAEHLESEDVLWIVGYPAESSFIDYEASKIKGTRSIIRAIYRGASISDHCHELFVDSSIKLDDYDGLSGAPVYYLRKNSTGEIVVPVIVGMILRGTASSRVAHFVSSTVILNLINLVEQSA